MTDIDNNLPLENAIILPYGENQDRNAELTIEVLATKALYTSDKNGYFEIDLEERYSGIEIRLLGYKVFIMGTNGCHISPNRVYLVLPMSPLKLPRSKDKR